MQVLKEIQDGPMPDNKNLELKETSRAVLFDDKNLVPLLFVSKYNYHKLPGGGIEKGEDSLSAINREAMEELGAKIKITGEVGQIIEYKSKLNLKQISYCYFGKVISKGQPSFTEEEINHGFQIVWLPIDEAIAKIMSDQPQEYNGHFIQQRDLIFLQKAKDLIKQNAA